MTISAAELVVPAEDEALVIIVTRAPGLTETTKQALLTSITHAFADVYGEDGSAVVQFLVQMEVTEEEK
jgi:phenylpyruvate tautomerase PptA (4-oxalocrotonate tautomerase family)